ncbi:MAG TPA: hypothetical protein VNA19_00955 [Pyrinomonadaceae bacterium]|jgi:hypothetical protein|nr:hypothetical protein [Pyrinomonadaceae bacterium]
MSNELTESQVARVVAEVSRQAQLLERDERERLGRAQVVEILEELSLPVALLDPAMKELERREAEAVEQARYEKALAAQRRRRLWLVGSAIAALLILVLLVGSFMQRQRRALAAVGVVGPGRITRTTDDGGSLGTVTRDGSELFYRVTLERVPVAENLSLKCNWIDPNGRVVKQNSWQTRTTDKSVWATSCRSTLGAAAQAGVWSVEMLLDGRVLSRTDFRVE